MKKLFVFFFVLLVWGGCDDILDTASVHIIVPSDVYKVQIAVFEGSINEKNFLTKEIFRPSERVSMEVPSGDNRIFLAVSQNANGEAYQVGSSSEPVDLKPGSNANISITLTNINIYLWITDYEADWPEIEAVSSYKLIRTKTPGSNDYITVYDGPAIHLANVIGSSGETPYTYKVAGVYSYFNITTIWAEEFY